NANNIKISSIREIRKFLSMNFDEVKYRIILISEAHLMNDEAQNALLKNLEEPPEGAIFILLTSNRNLLLDTIISRCWLVNFEPLSTDDIISILTRNFSIDEGTSRSLALFSNGSVYKALDFLKHDFDNFKSRVINILRYSIASKFHSAYKEIQPLISDSSGQSLKLVIQLIIFWFIDVQKNKYQIQDYFFWEDSETVEKFNLKFSNIDINNIVVNLSSIEQSVDYNVNLNILALNIIFELASLRFNRI
ncbi:MAG: ATP-binding protein, partial [Clostridiales bacterium]